jgi:serine/threonine protein kinase
MSGNTLPLAPVARSLGKYEVLCRLSTGGMAEIFLASQRGLAGFRKLVVLKQILPDIRGEEEFVRMFLDEAKVTAAFNHPHIAQVYDLDIAEGELFLSMEFVPGATLVEVARACRQANHPIPLGFSLMAVRDTAVALHYAHTFTDPLGRPSPVIHRDVAEKNIMVTYEGVTKLLDFGIAKSLARASRTAVGMVKGTSGYMSPEQVLGEPLDARSDLFSLGVVLHECLTGMRLFYAKQAEAMMNAVLRCEVQPPSRNNKQVPPELDAIVLRALAKRREDRYASTLEFARALERAVGPLIWHPEQSSEVMQRLFADRREQTRQLLSGSTSNESTAEVNLAAMMAMGTVEPSEQPTGGAGLPQATPPPRPTPPPQARPPVAKPPTPPQGAPVPPRRPTLTAAPAVPPAESDTVGTVRTGVMPAAKRSRTMSSETVRPPAPPPAEAPPPPPAQPSFSPDTMRTVPGRPALTPEQTVRAVMALREPVTVPGLPEETTSRLTPRLPDAPPPPPPVEPPRPRARLTQEGMRTVAAPPPPPPAERDQHTAMVRMPVMPPEPGESSVSVTPPSPRRAPPRRRQPPPLPTLPPLEPEAVTHPAQAFNPEQPVRDGGPAMLGDEDPHGNTQTGLRAQRGGRRGGGWIVALGGLLLVLGLGSAAVMLGLDGGRVSAWLKPLLSRSEAPAKPPEAAPTATVTEPQGPVDTGAPPAVQDAPDAGPQLAEAAPSGTPELKEDAPEQDVAPIDPTPTPRKRPSVKRAPPVKKGEPQSAADAGSPDAPPGEPGMLTLHTNPKARVFLGDQELGVTPLKVKLPPGEHLLRLQAVDGDGKALTLPVDIKSGETLTMNTPLALLSE